ncbi:MAG: hypothetical protein QNI87_00860 [Erythrobacter sp.]|uniref:Rossmann fold domain-containing protein n=1 Tax=Erythrobacter sp. TaxID=1042 RepID=UPI00260604D7|nr:hypothetical protein [Erythrobacter sp.]MDJ0977067.1 hypothetical protein [Erythrobacter sp.]
MGAARHFELSAGEGSQGRSPLEAHEAFMMRGLGLVRQTIQSPDVASLTITLPPAGSDHDAWRRALAGDLAREYTPKRVNIAAGKEGKALDTILAYLRDAPGVTGQYIQAHD